MSKLGLTSLFRQKQFLSTLSSTQGCLSLDMSAYLKSEAAARQHQYHQLKHSLSVKTAEGDFNLRESRRDRINTVT